MACFYYFKDKYGEKSRRKSAPTPTTLAIVKSPTSNHKTSRSEETATSATKLISKSVGAESSPRTIPELYEKRAHNLRVFDIKELINATNNFNRLLKIGEGGFGSVYKGSVKPADEKGGENNIIVAIKKLNPEGLQGHKQWLAEVQFLGVVEHPNLVKLIGYCAVDGERGPQRLLVYEFMTNKTLDDHLFNKAYRPLPWTLRLQIALGAAEGLAYLHEGLEVQVIYRDFKASNVLLNEEFRPKLSDFGLAREGPTAGHTHVSTAVMGTYGYAAPDYVETGHLTAKSDVWSFGVVLYEILTGRRSTERNRPRNEQKLLDWVKQFPVESSRFSLIIDPRLENKYSICGAREIAKLANKCLAKQGSERPSMREVVEVLRQALEYEDLDGQVGPVEELSPAPPEVDGKAEKESGLTSAKRRMLHLEKMGANQNAFGRRKFMLMRAANQA